MRNVSLLVLLLASIASSANGAQSSEPKPVGNPAGWITTDDYPRAALRAAIGGSVNFTLKIDAEGSVIDCIVTDSSGNQALDDGTCSLMKARARFIAARDTDGNPIASTYHSRVNWRIPNDGPIPLPATQSLSQTLTFDVDSTGQFRSCTASGETPSWVGVVEQLCARLPLMKIRFAPEKGQQLRHVTITVHFDVTQAKR